MERGYGKKLVHLIVVASVQISGLSLKLAGESTKHFWYSKLSGLGKTHEVFCFTALHIHSIARPQPTVYSVGWKGKLWK